MSVNSNRIIRSYILKKEEVVDRPDGFLDCIGPLENLRSGTKMQKWVKEGNKNQFSE